MAALLEVDDLRAVTARLELYRRCSRIGQTVDEVAEPIIYATVKESYQLSSIAAMEDACGIDAPEPVRELRRLLYCGDWIESHALHVFFLHGPDFPRLLERVCDGTRSPPHRRLLRVVGGREIHPVNVRVGGF